MPKPPTLGPGITLKRVQVAPGQKQPRAIYVHEGEDGSRWFYGDGPPPDTIIGAAVGDHYLDNITGTFYRLSPG